MLAIKLLGLLAWSQIAFAANAAPDVIPVVSTGNNSGTSGNIVFELSSTSTASTGVTKPKTTSSVGQIKSSQKSSSSSEDQDSRTGAATTSLPQSTKPVPSGKTSVDKMTNALPSSSSPAPSASSQDSSSRIGSETISISNSGSTISDEPSSHWKSATSSDPPSISTTLRSSSFSELSSSISSTGHHNVSSTQTSSMGESSSATKDLSAIGTWSSVTTSLSTSRPLSIIDSSSSLRQSSTSNLEKTRSSSQSDQNSEHPAATSSSSVPFVIFDGSLTLSSGHPVTTSGTVFLYSSGKEFVNSKTQPIPDQTQVTSIMTTLPPSVSTEILSDTSITANTWLTTTDKDHHTTIVPVIVPPCVGGGCHGIVVWNVPEIPRITFNWTPKFPKLPKFNLPCIKLFGHKVAGDCQKPPSTSGSDDEGSSSKPSDKPTNGPSGNPTENPSGSPTRNPSGEPSNGPSASPTDKPSSRISESSRPSRSSSSSCTQSETASDCLVQCSMITGSAGRHTTSSHSCTSTHCSKTVTGCSVTGKTSTTVASEKTLCTPAPLPWETETSDPAVPTCPGGCLMTAASTESSAPIITARAILGNYIEGKHRLEARARMSGIPILGNCPPMPQFKGLDPRRPNQPYPPAFIPEYLGGQKYLAAEIGGNLSPEQLKAPRWVTTTNCPATITTMNAQTFKSHNQVGSADHTFEKSLPKAFFERWLLKVGTNSIRPNGGLFDCNKLNKYFFQNTGSTKVQLDQNRMSAVWLALPSDPNYEDFAMMNEFMNGQCKGQLVNWVTYNKERQKIKKETVAYAIDNMATGTSSVESIMQRKFDFLTRTNVAVLMMNWQPIKDSIERVYQRIGSELKKVDNAAVCLNEKRVLRDEWVAYNHWLYEDPTNGLNPRVKQAVQDTLSSIRAALAELKATRRNGGPSWASKSGNSNKMQKFQSEYNTLHGLSTTLGTPNDQNWRVNFDAKASANFKRDDSEAPACALPGSSSSATHSASLAGPPSSSGQSQSPAVVSSSLSKTSSQPPASSTSSAPSYATGQCTVHIVQYLIPEGDKSPTPGLALNVTIKDAKHNEIGFSKNDSPSTWEHDTLKWGDTLNVESQLPYVLEVKAEPNVKNKNKRGEKLIDPPPPTKRPSIYKASDIEFKYAGQDWSTSDNKQCSVGGWADEGFIQNLKDHYDHETRQMDCTFNC